MPEEPDHRSSQQAPPIQPSPTGRQIASGRPSSPWLWAALAATVVAAVAIVALFVGLAPESPGASATTEGVSSVSGTDTLVVAVARTPGGPTEWSNWALVIKQMGEELNVPVSVRYLSKEDEAADVIAAEDIDVAFVCAHQYLELVDRGAVNGVATPAIDGDPLTTSMLVVRADDEAQSLDDLEGTVVAASDKSSLGGYAYLNAVCDEHGVDPEEFFSEVRLGETQDSNVRDLLDGKIRSTVINSAQVVAWDTSGFKAVESSKSFGAPPVVVSADMDPELAESVREFLLAFDADTLPTESHISGFVALDESYYDYAEILRDACGQHYHP